MKFIILSFFVIVYTTKFSDAKTFTVVLDTSQKMARDILSLHNNLKSIFDARALEQIDYFKLYLVNGESVSPPITYRRIDSLVQHLGGNWVYDTSTRPQCGINSIPGIERALEEAEADSFIFVFTNALPKNGTVDKTSGLCKSKNSKVQIFFSDICQADSRTDFYQDLQVFKDITRGCTGNLLPLNYNDLPNLLRFMNAIITKEWNDVTHHITEMKSYRIVAESYVQDMAVVITCFGQYNTFSYKFIEKLSKSNYVEVLQFKSLNERQYEINVGCHGTTDLAIYKKINLPFQIGFAPRRPLSFRETVSRPLPGRLNFIAIKINENINLDSLILKDTESHDKKVKLEFDAYSKLFIANETFEPYKDFILTISGYDIYNNKRIPSAKRLLRAQDFFSENVIDLPKVTVEIIPPRNTTILYDSTVTLSCRVTAYPPPDITWEDQNGIKIPSQTYELILPSEYISYMEINNFIKKNTFYCKVINGIASKSEKLELSVYRPPTLDIIKTIEDTTIEYLAEGSLQYSLSAYPAAEIQWYHNGSDINPTNDRYEVTDNGLIIKNMTLETVGIYECEAKNDFKQIKMEAEVSISGLDIPELYLESEVIVNPGNWKQIECSVKKGYPKPTITWTYKGKDTYDFSSLPDDVFVVNDMLKFGEVRKQHAGIYKCTAENFIGSDSQELNLVVQYQPSIEKDVEKVKEIEGNRVSLHCKIDAVPPADVMWMKNDIKINTDKVNADNTLMFQARHESAGVYMCLAKNDLGSDQKSIVVEIFVRPRIDIQPKTRLLVKRVGDSLNLDCYVKKGCPLPTLTWNFEPLENNKPIIPLTNPVQIRSVTKEDGGFYRCIGRNTIATDRVVIEVKIE